MLKKLFTGLAVLVLLFLIVAFFLPSNYYFERQIWINASPQKVFNYVSDYQKWESFSPWKAHDEKASYFFEGEPGKPGMKMQWKGKVIGEGSLTLVDATPHSEIIGHLQFFKPFVSQSRDRWVFEEKDGGTLVKWQNIGELGFPVQRYMGLFMDKMMSSDFERGLSSLKDVLESE